MPSVRLHISSLLFLFVALALSASAQEIDSEFCGTSTPPAHVLKAWQDNGRIGHACCTDSVCRCTSMICGGPSASLEDQDLVVVQLGERLPKPKIESLKPSGRELPEETISDTISQLLLEPPTPPPPQE